jgi:mannose-6-phosphate isomerase-like protein (cupin superfamily)
MEDRAHISTGAAADMLAQSGQNYVELFRHGSLLAEYYQPVGEDQQHPHDRDEIYVIAAGSGIFVHEESRRPFQVGDFIFVKAGDVHRFEEFTEDFATWVFFYGPVGGETNTQ